MSETLVNRQWFYAKPITDHLTADNFARREVPVPELRQGQALIRNRLISIDPANRLYFAIQNYRRQIELGDVMAAFAIGEVVKSTDPRFRVGDLWHGDFGWQDYAVINSYDRAEYYHRCTPGMSDEDLLGVYGITGMTAYFGVEKVGRLTGRETVVVGGATGACGAIIGQLAKIAGCRVVGFAGGPEKCAWLTGEMGFDAAVDYRAPDMAQRLAAECPDGVDFFSDAIGGAISQATIPLMKKDARWYHFGNMSEYDNMVPGETAPRHDAFLTPELKAICKERNLRPIFLLVFDFYCRRLEAQETLASYIADGRLKAPNTTLSGFEKLPAALIDGSLGSNKLGKLNVRLAG
ncbi:MAG: NADP-dependent oxidoreductase [Rhodobiaceae bacterium]|nr:NADP-dependent oxidoreductase [Rhodobiaceae bacterium]MCC0054524.1 NADP-dependent oxidoreductase [Rhodobiaceae bacterium]